MPARPSRPFLVVTIAAIIAVAGIAVFVDSAHPRPASATTAAPTSANATESTSTGGNISSPVPSRSGGSGPGTPDTTLAPLATFLPTPTTQVLSAASATTTTATDTVWVSVLSATPQTSDDVNAGLTPAAAQSLVTQLSAYWSAQSGGAVTLALAGFETRSLGQSGCNPNAALSAEEVGAFGGMFANGAWKGTHQHLIVLSAESCNAASFATVGGSGGEIFSGNGIGASMGVPYLLHEFGHNLGFEHADASICTNTGSYDGTAADFSFTSTVCPTREYDDYFDIMGYTVKNATPNLSSPQRILAGWLTNYATITSSTPSTTKTLTALGGSGGTQALKITDPISGDIYYVEYRADSGLDATSAEFNYGLQCDPAMSGYTICELDSSKTAGAVRILRTIRIAATGAIGTTVMASALTAGSSDKTKRHTHLNSGDNFTSVDGGFTVRVVSMSPSAGASISVTFGAGGISSTPTPSPTDPAVPDPTGSPAGGSLPNALRIWRIGS
jgi:hypothetical protein